MRRIVLATISAVGLLASVPASAQGNLMSEAKDLFKPIPSSPPEIEGNPATPEKVELGKMLYFDPRLSESHTISCNSCHVVGLGGVDMLETSVGHRWQRGGRNAPTVLNSVFNTAQFWDGRAKDLADQAGGPMVNPVEMASSREHVVEQLRGIPGYGEEFKRAYRVRASLLANLKILAAFYPYQLMLMVAAFRAVYRIFTENNSWEKTAHTNNHRKSATATPFPKALPGTGSLAANVSNGVSSGGTGPLVGGTGPLRNVPGYSNSSN